MRLIDADELLNKTAELEAVALEQVAKYGPLSDIHPGEWHRWDAILTERTAFKYDLMDAPTIDAVEVVRCKDCIHNKTLQKGTFGDILGYDGECAIVRMLIRDNYYCVWGERRDK